MVPSMKYGGSCPMFCLSSYFKRLLKNSIIEFGPSLGHKGMWPTLIQPLRKWVFLHTKVMAIIIWKLRKCVFWHTKFIAIAIWKWVFWVDQQCLNQILLDAWSFLSKDSRCFDPNMSTRVREKLWFGIFPKFQSSYILQLKVKYFLLKNWHSFVWLQVWRFPPIDKMMMMLVIELHIWHLIFECKKLLILERFNHLELLLFKYNFGNEIF